MAITAADIKALRDKTGVGMMECKKALTEAPFYKPLTARAYFPNIAVR